MKENILEVLIYLFEHHMEDNCDITINQDLLVNELKFAGFTNEEITHAFDWLEGLAKSSESLQSVAERATPDSLRILTAQEKQRLGIDCWGFLAFLEQIGILNPVTRELVIDRALGAANNGALEMSDLKWVILMVLFNQPDERAALKAMENLVLSQGSEESVH